jgi:hypothetical protein
MFQAANTTNARTDIYDSAAWNFAQVEEVGLVDFEETLVDDFDAVEWDKVLGADLNQCDLV